jgi:hypothetical protein
VISLLGSKFHAIYLFELGQTTSKVPIEYDFWKLNELKRQLGYRHGLFLMLDTMNGRAGIKNMLWDREIPQVEI